MKWLFGILVVLNIVVFGSMVAGKMVRDNMKIVTAVDTNVNNATMPVPVPTPLPPADPNISIQTELPEGHTATSDAEIKTGQQAKSELANQAAERDKEKNKDKNKDKDKDKDKDEPKIDQAINSVANTRNCTATVSIPEDDFHRIKGLFSQWPFTTSRFVEKASQPKPRAATSRYAVTLPGTSSDADLKSRLNSQGFDYGLVQGQISLGVFNRRADAESLLARAKMHGFGEAIITALNERDNTDNAATSVAKMRVVFTGINNAAIRDINEIVSRYGRLQSSGVCQ